MAVAGMKPPPSPMIAIRAARPPRIRTIAFGSRSPSSKGRFCGSVQGRRRVQAIDFDLTPKSAVVEKGLLLLGGDAAEQRVAMREAAEPADDVGVLLRPFQQVGVAGRGK